MINVEGTKKERRLVRKTLNRLPRKLRAMLVDVTFRVVDGSGFGKFDYLNRTATIYRKPWYYFGRSIVTTTLHEAGHWLDLATGTQSLTEMFRLDRFDDWKYLRRYERDNGPEEAFADTVLSLWGPWWAKWYLGKRPKLKKRVREILK